MAIDRYNFLIFFFNIRFIKSVKYDKKKKLNSLKYSRYTS